MNYEDMSYFEINKAVAEFRFRDCAELEVHRENKNSDRVVVVSQGIAIALFDLNNPLDAWPIIVENKINLFLEDDSCVAAIMPTSYAEEDICVDDKNPLRAAMIVYLMKENSDE